MGLEAATTIAELVITNPDGDDKLNQGDNHIRMVKDVLKLVFAGSNGLGFDKPITATEDELNFLGGTTSNINDRFDSVEASLAALTGELSAPTGTKLNFPQAAAPNGWTIDATVTDHMMRVVDGTTLVGGATGGTDDPVLNDKTPIHGHTAVAGLDGEHAHAPRINGTDGDWGAPGACSSFPFLPGAFTSCSGGPRTLANIDNEPNGEHDHIITVNDNLGENWEPRFVNNIICVKD